jgi:NAD(P)-dependent dehydrogenase (short-subunit alcohol dehydrogenase family)
MTPEQWELDHRRNLRHFFFTARAVAGSLIRREKPGAIACIASVSGLQSAPHHASYGAAKAGLMNLVRTMAVEWAPHDIRVNAIAPGSIATPRIPDTPEARERHRQSLIPMKRRGTTDEIGKVATFLVSDLASYVTGHTVPVDGGWMAMFLSGVPELGQMPRP